MNLIKLLFILVAFTVFFFLIKHYNELENYNFNFNKNTIPIIETDSKPYKILPPSEENNNPLDNSCTLNDEC